MGANMLFHIFTIAGVVSVIGAVHAADHKDLYKAIIRLSAAILCTLISLEWRSP
jgi:hypothetical protein